MHSGDQEIEVDDILIKEGTSLYDTEYDRVLWVTRIDSTVITVRPVTDYHVVKAGRGETGGQVKTITDNTFFTIPEFKSLVSDGRFEVSP